MSLLSIVQSFCGINALAVPLTVVGSTDTTVKQLWAILNELLEDMTDESNWQAFTYQCTWTLIAAEDQGSIYDIASAGFLWAHNETFFDRTLTRPLYGPVTDVEWQELKALPNPGPWYKYRFRQDHLLINPTPTTPFSLIAFEYASNEAVLSSLGVPKVQFTADDDTSILPEKIIKRGLQYRWKQIKGLPYQADEVAYYKLLNNAIARDGTKRVYNLGQTIQYSVAPGIFVPSGNWPIP